MKSSAAKALRAAPSCTRHAIFLIATFVTAHGFVTLPHDLGEIRLTNTFTTSYDTNIYAMNQAVDDLLLKNEIVADYTRATNVLTLRGEVAWSLGWFEKNQQLSYDDPRFNFKIARPSGKLTGELELSSARSHEANGLLGMRTDKTNYRGGVSWRYVVIPRYSLTGSVNADETRYATSGLQSIKTTGATLGLNYSYTPKSDLVLTFHGSQTRTPIAGVATDLGANVGATGRFTRKLKGDVRLGVSSRRNDYETVDDLSLWADVSLTWDYSRRASWSATLSRHAQTVATGQNTVVSAASLSSRYQFNKQWTLTGGASAGWSQFLGATNRSDHHWGGSADLGYRWGEHWTLGLNTSFTQNTSNEISTARYSQRVVALRVSANW